MTARRLLPLLLAVHLALGQVYVWATPIFEAPDEGTHFAFVHWLATGHGLPVQPPRGAPGPWEQEGSQPPLYYALAAAAVRGIAMPDFEQALVEYPLTHMGVPGTAHSVNRYRHPVSPQPLEGTVLAVFVVRELSLLMSLITIALTYALSLALFADREWLALLAAALVAFNPMALFINASVNNDNLLMLLSTAALLVMVRYMESQERSRLSLGVGLGALLGLAALTKISGLVLWPIAALALLLGELRTPTGWRGQLAAGTLPRLFGRLLVVFGLAVLICAAWYWRNYQLYGEWLGLNTMAALAGPRSQAIGLLDLLLREGRGFVMSYWAVFGVFTILPAPWVQLLYDALVVLALVGGALTMLRGPARPKAASLLLALFCLLTLAGVVRWTLQTPASQGRLLFGAIAPLAIFLAAGLLAAFRPLLRLRAGREWSKGLALTLTGALALVAGVVPVAFIQPRYAPPRPLADAELPSDLRPLHAILADSVELVGYTASDEAVRPSQPITVTLYWRGLEPIASDYALALHVLGRDAEEVARLDTWPGGGLAATSQWPPGVLMADTYFLEVEEAAVVPSKLALDLYLWDGDPLQPLSLQALDGSALPSVTFDIGRAVPAGNDSPEPENEVVSEFEHGIWLLGYDVSADGALYLTLYWQLDADVRVPADYTVFMHVVDGQGIPVIEPADGPPLNGYWPTSAWEPRHTVADTRLVALPPNLHPGNYDLHIGLYDPASGVRLTAWQADGTPWPDNAVVLPGVIVK